MKNIKNYFVKLLNHNFSSKYYQNLNKENNKKIKPIDQAIKKYYIDSYNVNFW